ncbi:MAG TPA: DsbA family protein [Chromatiaceae bacterium]|nr:DsbA family protein [Chromatiaceae bacterium]
MQAVLYYVHDPMCSWCWAFGKVRGELLQQLPASLKVQRLLGGLAADTDEPMPPEMIAYVKSNWKAIENRLPHLRFNYDFWEICQPRRSTWPACRAVIAAREQGSQYDRIMTRAIQQAYYQQARNPSLNATLIALAQETGLDSQRFSQDLVSRSTAEVLLREISETRKLKARSFPGLALKTAEGLHHIPVDYQSAEPMRVQILALLKQREVP